MNTLLKLRDRINRWMDERELFKLIFLIVLILVTQFLVLHVSPVFVMIYVLVLLLRWPYLK